MIKVYHVANPDVAGYVRASTEDINYVYVLFEEPVSFSGNSTRPPSRDWTCNLDLLYNTPAEARRNSYSYKEKEKNKPTKRRLILD